MKKTIVLAVLLSFMVIPLALAEVGVEPEATFVFEKELKADGGKADIEYQEYSVGFPIKVANRLTVTPLIGVINEAELNIAGKEIELEDGEVLFGVKANVLLWAVDKYRLNLLGQYKRAELDIEPFQGITGEATYETYSCEARITGDFEVNKVRVNPYIGLVLSDADADLTLYGGLKSVNLDAEADDNIGISLGAEAKILDNFSVKVAGRLIDEESITIAGCYRF